MDIKNITKEHSAHLIEVFSAIQGEGLNVGTRQIFIRFALCDLRCHFCDSAHTWKIPAICKIEHTPGLRDFQNYSNPVTLEKLLVWIHQQNAPFIHDSISLTGGEPLIHAPFLIQFLPQVRELTELPIYLETAGHRPEQLTQLIPYLNLVGMDMKLPSVSGENYWQAHKEFLQLCYESKLEVFVKIIVSENTELIDLQTAGEIVGSINPYIPVFLQPVTPLDTATGSINQNMMLPPSPEQILTWQVLMKEFVKQVRVIPQTHKMLNQL
ncbi:MAG: 7-carboxy-7-deazaguanine synthase QueE [Richelia sp.]|nr:7-carboxy-7-deazaguanine synthase QueE [Richelia sp.]CDN12410.1 Queuosine Biosynthesis QueE Radical SAM [Richelia intracellularis]